MAFLDKSGDIILDAVLTETGRRKMAQGNFEIDRFALGDDEIDYSLYNKNHASGSAYYDLELLQTPVFEAFTQINAGINYGLLPFENTDLLYLPVAKVNELAGTTSLLSNIARQGPLFYVIDTSGDTGALNRISKKLNDNSPVVQFLEGTTGGLNFILIEAGLDTGTDQTPNGTKADRDNYLVANNLIDTSFSVYYDNRFFGTVRGPARASAFTNAGASDGFQGNIYLKRSKPISNAGLGIENYSAASISAISNEIYWNSSETDQDFSVINGPRSVVTAVALTVKTGLSAEYSLYGRTSQTLFNATVDYIDTTVYVVGNRSQAQVQLPIRIIKLS